MITNYPAAEAVNLNHVPWKDDVNANEETVGDTSDQKAHNDKIMD